ncbi:MAG: DUF4157 domain-containing protein [Deltaproteobacteria bacterium]|nr:DUF4157 domain-containing protein [Deltaproteobacteria bacterium]
MVGSDVPLELPDKGYHLTPSLRERHGWDIPDRLLDRVSLHTGASAAALARAHGARALTFGHHIAFDNGEFAPQQPRGARLFDHELFHATNPVPMISLDRKTDALRSVLEQNSTRALDGLDGCDLLWLKDKLLGVKDETLLGSLEAGVIPEIDERLEQLPAGACAYEPRNFDPFTGARGGPSLPGIDGPLVGGRPVNGLECGPAFEDNNGEIEEYWVCRPFQDGAEAEQLVSRGADDHRLVPSPGPGRYSRRAPT